jgi:PPOX class probable FMN-dependent enzyme
MYLIKTRMRKPMRFIENVAELRELYGLPMELAVKKVKNHLDSRSKSFIEIAPFLCLSTIDLNGSADCSPKGDPGGFVRILDDRTIAIPDRKGNNRLDSLVNILSCPKVGIIFFIPGRLDALRINGNAKLTTDTELLSTLEIQSREDYKGKLPKVAIIVAIEEVYFHCPKAIVRSNLWKTGELSRDAVERYIEISRNQPGTNLSQQEISEKTDNYMKALKEDLY